MRFRLHGGGFQTRQWKRSQVDSKMNQKSERGMGTCHLEEEVLSEGVPGVSSEMRWLSGIWDLDRPGKGQFSRRTQSPRPPKIRRHLLSIVNPGIQGGRYLDRQNGRHWLLVCVGSRSGLRLLWYMPVIARYSLVHELHILAWRYLALRCKAVHCDRSHVYNSRTDHS